MKSKILIIDDNEMMRSFLEHILSSDYDVEVVNSGEKAIKVLQDPAKTPELVLSDFDLVHMNGLDLVNFIKSSAQLKHLPVVIVTNNPGTKDKCIKAGAADFITKPFNPGELKAKIGVILQEAGVGQTTR